MSQLELSPRVAELAQLLGRRTALALCRAGGLIYVPIRLSPRTRLVQMIGPQGTAKLQERYAGRHLKLPKLAAIDREKRNAAIRQGAAAGASTLVLASNFGLTDRQVRNILRG